MAEDHPRSPASRRSLLSAGVGAAAAAAIGILERPLAARAHHDGYVDIGQNNVATNTTAISNTTNTSTVFRIGSTTGVGIYSTSDSRYGIQGDSDSSYGVHGTSQSSYAVYGRSATSIGVVGQSGPVGPPISLTKTGVYGVATDDATARGVFGESTSGRGVFGKATSGTGVYATATTGEAIHAESTSWNGVAAYSGSGIASGVYGENTAGGIGVMGKSTNGVAVAANTHGGIAVNALAEAGGTAVSAYSIGGTALAVNGRVTFTNAGLASVAVGAKLKVIGVATGLSPLSIVLCTLESNQARLHIQRVTKNIEANTFRVFLSAAVVSGKTAKVAWFVIG